MRNRTFRKQAALLGHIASPALAFGLLLVPFALAFVLVNVRLGVMLWYGGDVEAFDRHYEEGIQEQVAKVATPAAAFQLVAERWDPTPQWPREILRSKSAPDDLCLAESAVRDDGIVGLLIGCGSIEGFATDETLPDEHRTLSHDAHDRALWLTARGIKMLAARLPERGIIAIHQRHTLGDDEEVVYATRLAFNGKRDGADVLLDDLAQRIVVTANSSMGRHRSIMER